jgi:hypothetical protein
MSQMIVFAISEKRNGLSVTKIRQRTERKRRQRENAKIIDFEATRKASLV